MYKPLLVASLLLLQSIFLLAQTPQIPCPSNTAPASDVCANACIYCDFLGYTGSTTGFGAQAANGFCGSIENDQWLGFIAGQMQVSFTITPSNCSLGKGVEAAIYTSCSDSPVACVVGTGSPDPITIAAPAIIGHTYYLMIDGTDGDQCDFTVSAGQGSVAAPILPATQPITGMSNICPGSKGTYTVPPVAGASAYVWEGPPGSLINGQPSPVTITNTQVDVDFPEQPTAGVFEVCVQPINACAEGNRICKTIVIQPIPPIIFPNVTICQDDLPYITPWGGIAYTPGIIEQTLPSLTGCDTIFRQFVFVAPPIFRVLPPVSMCAGDSLVVCGNVYTESGVYTETCTASNGCDSIVQFIINVLNPFANVQIFAQDSVASDCTPLTLTATNWTTNMVWYNAAGDSIGKGRQIDITDVGWYKVIVPALANSGGTPFPFPSCQPAVDSILVTHIGSTDRPQITATLDSVDCNLGGAELSVHSNLLNPMYEWVFQNAPYSQDSVLTVTEGGSYFVQATAQGVPCKSNEEVVQVPYQIVTKQILVKGWIDTDQDCQLTSADTVVQQAKAVAISRDPAKPNVLLNSSSWSAAVMRPGEYDIAGIYPWEVCPSPPVIIEDCSVSLIDSLDILFKNSLTCPKLTISMVPWLLRRCFTGSYMIDYRNYGQLATDAYVEVELDSFLSHVSAMPPATVINGQTLRWDLGDVPAFAHGTIKINVNVACTPDLGYVHCSEARIYPDTTCIQWPGPTLEVNGTCVGDTAEFRIKNIGVASMTTPTDYFFFSNDTLFLPGTFGSGTVQLGVGQTQTIYVPAFGREINLIANQVQGYPFNQQAGATVNYCNHPSLNPIREAILGAQATSASYQSCIPNTGSFDPNDKTGYPLGIGEEHYIEQNSNISYVVRFQNTGTDTAFTVVIRDTLSPLLNPYSVRPGAASHPYTMQLVDGNILVFRFDQIMLPDSNVNEPGSHGAIEFTISQRGNNPLYAEIYNSAAIYFDFNDPIITKVTKHSNGIPPRVILSTQTPKSVAQVTISPNPTTGVVLMSSAIYEEGEKINYLVVNTLGQRVGGESTQTGRVRFDATSLASGVYFVEMSSQDGRKRAVGRFVKD